MEPTHETQPSGTELPTPQEDATKPVSSPEASPPASAEIQAALSQPSIPVGLPVQSTTTDAGAGQQTNDPGGQTLPLDTSSLIADDADLIEKEWVVRAKSIVNQTKDDPFIQNKEINKVKAEYIKKRYNKDMKLSEG